MGLELWKPEVYQGSRRTRRYFEGWYFKQTTGDRAETWAFIPGVSRGDGPGAGCSFVQAIEGRTARTWWFEYPLSAFSASRERLEVEVGPNRFSARGLELDLRDPGSGSPAIRGALGFGAFSPLPRSVLAPGVMGPYAFVPFMECYHGLVSLDHEVLGGLEVEGRKVDFSGGRGYAEKDWGVSMPSSWIWTQSNNFPRVGDSFMLSVARIPWLRRSFTGFLCVARLDGIDYRFTTWNRARLAELRAGEAGARIVIERGDLRLSLRASKARAGLLRAPVAGLLSRRISESVDARMEVRLERGSRTVYEGAADRAGLELVGEPAELGALPLSPP